MEEEEEEVAVKFLELIQTLLKDPQERQEFFSVRQHHSKKCITIIIIIYAYLVGRLQLSHLLLIIVKLNCLH